MAIEFSKDYPSFRITDTLHQLVDRLNDFEDLVQSNTALMDSGINDLLSVVHRDSGTITPDGDLEIVADNLTLTTDSAFASTSDTLTLTSNKSAFLNAGKSVVLSGDLDTANVLLRSAGATYGALRNNANQLEIMTGLSVGLTFTTGNVTVPGTITMPSSGNGSPYTTDKTVNGAINELHEELETITTEELARITTLEGRADDVEGDVSTLDTRSTSNANRISNLEAINIASRLNTIEANITQINNRLNILEL